MKRWGSLLLPLLALAAILAVWHGSVRLATDGWLIADGRRLTAG